MQRVAVCAAAFLAAALLVAPAHAGAAAAQDDSVAAIQKVINMLNTVLSKSKEEKQAEEVSFSAFNQWCKDHQASLTQQVATGKQNVESLTAEINKLTTDARTLGDEVAALQADTTRFEGEAASRKAQREQDYKAFLAEQQDYAESVDALDRAISVLQKQNFDRSALLQVAQSQQLPVSAQQMVAAFLGMMDDKSSDPDFLGRSAPQADAYEFQSGGIIDMLKKLKGEFKEKKTQCEKEEANAKHAHDMILQDLTDSAEKSKKDAATKASEKLQKQEKAAVQQRDLDSTSAVLAEDEKTLSSTSVECREKIASFQEKQQLRAEEIEAIEKAIEILTSPDMAGGAKHLDLVQTSKKTSALLQVGRKGAAGVDETGIRQRLRDFLLSESQRLHSSQLGLLVEKVALDPFGKVKQMISDMITRLMEQARQEAEHKGFCDKELGVNKLTREELTETIDRLTADVEGGKANIAQLTEDIASLSKAVSEIDGAVKEATDLRQAEKARNAATVKDAEGAEAAVQAATKVLQDFYAKAAQATALIQEQVQRAPTAAWGKSSGIKMGTPEWNALANPSFKGTLDLGHQAGQQTFGETYQGKQAEAGGILAMLEVIASDFASLKAETMSSEMLSQKAFEEFLRESKKDKAVKSKKIELSNTDKGTAEQKLLEDTQDLKFTEDKLLAANRYYDNLVPQCIDQGVSHEARMKSRQDEIDSLKQALEILAGQVA